MLLVNINVVLRPVRNYIILSGRRFGYKKIIPFEDYVDMFDAAGVRIEERVQNMSDLLKNHDKTLPTLSQVIVGKSNMLKVC